MMNADMLTAIETGKAKLAAIRKSELERQEQGRKETEAERNYTFAQWAKLLAAKLPTWAQELMSPYGNVSEWNCSVVLNLPIGTMIFPGHKLRNGEIAWDDIEVRTDGDWYPCGQDFLAALGSLAEMKEQEDRNAAEWERQGDVAEAQVAAVEAERPERPEPALDPFKQIAAFLERIANAVEDVAAITVAFEPLLKQLTEQVEIAGTVGVWGDEDDADPLAIPL